MSEYTALLLTFYSDGQLLKIAVEILTDKHQDQIKYFMMPEHKMFWAEYCGYKGEMELVDLEEIFEVR